MCMFGGKSHRVCLCVEFDNFNQSFKLFIEISGDLSQINFEYIF